MDYPIPAYNYQVTIGGETMAFSEISGLSIEYDNYLYKHGRSFRTGAKRLLSSQSSIRISMKRGIFQSGQLQKFYKWISGLDHDRISKTDATIVMCDENGDPVITWNATGCVPAKLEIGQLSASQSQPAISTFEIIAGGLSLVEETKENDEIETTQDNFSDFPEVHQGYRFRVDFLGITMLEQAAEATGRALTGDSSIGNIDSAFQSVSGLGSEIAVETIGEGGQNIASNTVPTRVQHGNLVLTRGLVNISAINLSFNAAMTALTVVPTLVTVILLSDSMIPVSCWAFAGAYPVKWSTSDLDATQYAVAVDTMELAYSRMYRISV